MEPLPADVQALVGQIEHADRAADTLVSALSDQQLQWQPEGGWSVAQCLEHLAAINLLHGESMKRAIDRARQAGSSRAAPLTPGPFGRWFIKGQEPPVTRRFRSPRKMRPRSGLSRTDVLTRYHDSHARLKELARAAATIDANRTTYPNPLFGLLRFKLATGLLALPAHDRRHLWQAERITRHPDFPR